MVLVLLCISVASADCPFEKLGETYSAKTEDGFTIKLLRYAPAGEKPNYGSQPVLLFSGLLCNMAEYLPHTPDNLREVYRMELKDLADWAKEDPRIEKDPMLYYSFAYYLWKKGYDVWLANYRGTGCGNLKSEIGSVTTSLDTWAIYDTPAAVRKVYEVTKKNPIIGGHSTGGLVTYVFLQGSKFVSTPSCLLAQPWCKRVVGDDKLSSCRNGDGCINSETVIGVIAIDPAMIPPLPRTLDTKIGWIFFDTPMYIEIRKAIEEVSEKDIAWKTMMMTTDILFKVIYNLYIRYGEVSEIIRDLTFVNPDNMNAQLNDFLVRYVIDNLYTPTLAQYADFGLRKTAREYFENGGRGYITVPPEPKPGKDGYYYYIYNMEKIRVPYVTVLSELPGLVDAEQIVRDLMKAKKLHELDRYLVVKNTGHLEIPFGLNAPKEVFPYIGQWLDELQRLKGYETNPH